MTAEFREREVYPHLRTAVEQRLADEYAVEVEPRVTYALHYDRDRADGPSERGFRTDLCVLADGVPLVAVEVKRGGATTHDLMVYDRKARQHKRVHEPIRYGMVVVDADGRLTPRYLRHAASLDFFYFLEGGMAGAADLDDAEMDDLAALLDGHLESARAIADVLAGDGTPRRFDRRVDVGTD